MNKTMRAAVLHAPNVFTIEDVPIPQPGYGEVLVKIMAVSICGSDPGIFGGAVLKDGWPPHYPFIAGHEFAGVIETLGEGVVTLKPGDRVAGEAHCGCGVCENCKKGLYNLCKNYGRYGHHHYGHATPGCYAQYQVYDQKALTLMPDNVGFDEGSTVDTAGIAFHGISLAGIVPGGWTAIIGPGPMGLLLMQMAKAMGSKTIVIGYNDPDRLNMALKTGADYVVETLDTADVVETVRNLTNGEGVNSCFDCAGAGDTLDKAIRMTGAKGHVAVIAYPKQTTTQEALYYMVKNEITVHGVRANPNCSARVLGLMSSGKLRADKIITHCFPLEQLHEAFDTFIHHLDGAVRVVIHPNNEEKTK